MQADLLTGLVFIPYLGDAYQTQPQTWPGLGLCCLSDSCSLGGSTTDVFVPWGLRVKATTKTRANQLHVQQNRSHCLLTYLSLAFLKGTGEVDGVLVEMNRKQYTHTHTASHFVLRMKPSKVFTRLGFLTFI